MTAFHSSCLFLLINLEGWFIMHVYVQAEIADLIEQARANLNELGEKQTLISTELLDLSGKLDELIVEFHRLSVKTEPLAK